MEKETEMPWYSDAEDMVNQTIWIMMTTASEGSNTPILQHSNTPIRYATA